MLHTKQVHRGVFRSHDSTVYILSDQGRMCVGVWVVCECAGVCVSARVQCSAPSYTFHKPPGTLQFPRLLQLRPHRKPYKDHTLHMVWRYKGTKSEETVHGCCQGYFTQAGLDGWGNWFCPGSNQGFVGEWRAGKRSWGTFTDRLGTTYTGWLRNEQYHGLTRCVKRTGEVIEFNL
jgi:hypothetical protein